MPKTTGVDGDRNGHTRPPLMDIEAVAQRLLGRRAPRPAPGDREAHPVPEVGAPPPLRTRGDRGMDRSLPSTGRAHRGPARGPQRRVDQGPAGTAQLDGGLIEGERRADGIPATESERALGGALPGRSGADARPDVHDQEPGGAVGEGDGDRRPSGRVDRSSPRPHDVRGLGRRVPDDDRPPAGRDPGGLRADRPRPPAPCVRRLACGADRAGRRPSVLRREAGGRARPEDLAEDPPGAAPDPGDGQGVGRHQGEPVPGGEAAPGTTEGADLPHRRSGRPPRCRGQPPTTSSSASPPPPVCARATLRAAHRPPQPREGHRRWPRH